ncbi:MAG: L,D-transpeptidase family protein [Rhizobiales bacterium]|nr:L,D-transpeptidase family protein [Hyphomicrobiales bacterium]
MNRHFKPIGLSKLFARSSRIALTTAMGFSLIGAPLPAFAISSLSENQPDDIQQISTPENPLSLIISLDEQTIDIYRGIELIDSSRISTGKTGYESPSGIFSILQKNRFHRSNIYSNAPMPFMQRLTWSGIALHAGRVPDFPASHGCIRLPTQFATTLFGMTERGVHVIVSHEKTFPEIVRHENLFQPQPTRQAINSSRPEALRYASTKVNLETANPAWMMADFEADLARDEARLSYSDQPLRILITRRTGRERLKDVQSLLNQLGYEAGDVDGYMGSATAKAVQDFKNEHEMPTTGIVTDELITSLYRAAGRGLPQTGHIYVRQGFRDLFDAPVRIARPEEALGTHIYTAMEFHPLDDQVQWVGITAEASPVTGLTEALDRIEIPSHLKRQISDMLTPGTSVTISDNGISNETNVGTDFIVLTHQSDS